MSRVGGTASVIVCILLVFSFMWKIMEWIYAGMVLRKIYGGLWFLLTPFMKCFMINEVGHSRNNRRCEKRKHRDTARRQSFFWHPMRKAEERAVRRYQQRQNNERESSDSDYEEMTNPSAKLPDECNLRNPMEEYKRQNDYYRHQQMKLKQMNNEENLRQQEQRYPSLRKEIKPQNCGSC